MTDFVIQPGVTRDLLLTRTQKFIAGLSAEKAWQVTVKEWKKPRSSQQNRYLFGVCYPTILREGGEAMQGWTADDLHEFFLIGHFGHEVLDIFGKKRQVPLRRSSKLNKAEFCGFVDYIQRFMAEHGVYIPDADPMYGVEI